MNFQSFLVKYTTFLTTPGGARELADDEAETCPGLVPITVRTIG